MNDDLPEEERPAPLTGQPDPDQVDAEKRTLLKGSALAIYMASSMLVMLTGQAYAQADSILT